MSPLLFFHVSSVGFDILLKIDIHPITIHLVVRVSRDCNIYVIAPVQSCPTWLPENNILYYCFTSSFFSFRTNAHKNTFNNILAFKLFTQKLIMSGTCFHYKCTNGDSEINCKRSGLYIF